MGSPHRPATAANGRHRPVNLLAAPVSARVLTSGAPLKLADHPGCTITAVRWIPNANLDATPTTPTTVLVENVAAADGARTAIAGPVFLAGIDETSLPLDGGAHVVAPAGRIELTVTINGTGRTPSGTVEITQA